VLGEIVAGDAADRDGGPAIRRAGTLKPALQTAREAL
jgi:hypothetical protein